MIKRIFDIIMASVGLVVFLPLFAVITVWIKLDSSGTILYRGCRIGRYGRSFSQLKFRTMIVNAEQLGSSRTPDTDYRITRLGRILRQYKLDELPQLLNILMGDMSFVGPRPDVEEYAVLYTDSEKGILKLRPGLTDWATLWYRDEGKVLSKFTDPDTAYKKYFHPVKVKLQLDYLYDHSFLIDICIMSMTVIAIFRESWLPEMLASRLRRIREPAALATEVSGISERHDRNAQ